MSEFKYPENCKYTKNHEWIRLNGALGAVGITNYAQGELGDIVFVELPKAGTKVFAGKPCGSVESVKAVTDIFAPVSGEVKEANEALAQDPALLNRDPHGEGWMMKIALSDPSELEALMSAGQYQEYIAKGH